MCLRIPSRTSVGQSFFALTTFVMPRLDRGIQA